MERLAPIPLNISRLANCLHGLAGILALAAICYSGLHMAIKVFLALLLLGMSIQEYREQCRMRVRALACDEQHWWIMMDNQKMAIELCGEQLVLPWLVVIQFFIRDGGVRDNNIGIGDVRIGAVRYHQKKQVLALWPDSANRDDLRRLRVFLRFGPSSR